MTSDRQKLLALVGLLVPQLQRFIGDLARGSNLSEDSIIQQIILQYMAKMAAQEEVLGYLNASDFAFFDFSDLPEEEATKLIFTNWFENYKKEYENVLKYKEEQLAMFRNIIDKEDLAEDKQLTQEQQKERDEQLKRLMSEPRHKHDPNIKMSWEPDEDDC